MYRENEGLVDRHDVSIASEPDPRVAIARRMAEGSLMFDGDPRSTMGYYALQAERLMRQAANESGHAPRTESVVLAETAQPGVEVSVG